jgi:transcription antitermination protein NusB
MKPRTKARSVALQVLYELDIANHNPQLVLVERLEESTLEPTLEDFVRQIVLGVWAMVDILDNLISKHAPEWPLDQVATIDRNIIRISLWEFAVFEKTPIKVAINEAVELAKVYGSDSTPRFVNGVLGSLAGHFDEIQTFFKSTLHQSFEDTSLMNK